MTRLLRCGVLGPAFLLTCELSGGCSSPTAPGALRENIGGVWTLTTLQRAGQSEMAPPTGTTFSLEITEDRAAVAADCNRCSGPAAVSANSLTIGPVLACTRVFCASAPFDDTFVRILSGDSAATIDGNSLTLRSDRGVLRLRR